VGFRGGDYAGSDNAGRGESCGHFWYSRSYQSIDSIRSSNMVGGAVRAYCRGGRAVRGRVVTRNKKFERATLVYFLAREDERGGCPAPAHAQNLEKAPHTSGTSSTRPT
jgi:hypothetical protein